MIRSCKKYWRKTTVQTVWPTKIVYAYLCSIYNVTTVRQLCIICQLWSNLTHNLPRGPKGNASDFGDKGPGFKSQVR